MTVVGRDNDGDKLVPSRARFVNVPGADEVFTPDFLRYVVELHDRFSNRILFLRQRREVRENN